MASMRAAPSAPSRRKRVFPSSTEVTMSSTSKETLVSEKVMKRSMKSCILEMVFSPSAGTPSQKAPIRSRMASRP